MSVFGFYAVCLQVALTCMPWQAQGIVPLGLFQTQRDCLISGAFSAPFVMKTLQIKGGSFTLYCLTKKEIEERFRGLESRSRSWKSQLG